MSEISSGGENPTYTVEDVLDFFGFDEPYEAQEEGMVKALETVGSGGFLVFEGACGTGKTMFSLSPVVKLIRDEETPYKRVIVATSVRQQQRAFETDLKQINDNLPAGINPVSSITLAKKSALCPYTREGVVEEDKIYGKCERVREETRDMVSAVQNPETFARNLASDATPEKYNSNEFGSKAAEFDNPDIDYPYVSEDPEQAFGYCPFYAKYTADKMKQPPKDKDNAQAATKRKKNPVLPYDMDSFGSATIEDVLKYAGEDGSCPHSVMVEAMQSAEVIIANYNHIFEPRTVNRMMQGLLDEETLLICDEAHNLVSKVRRLLGDSLSLYSIERAISELEGLVSLLELDSSVVSQLESLNSERLQEAHTANSSPKVYLQRLGLDEETAEAGGLIISNLDDSNFLINDLGEVSELAPFIQSSLEEKPLAVEDIKEFIEFCKSLKTFLMKQGSEKVELRHGSLSNISERDVEDTLEIQLRDPEKIEKDNLTWWSQQKGFDDALDNAKFVGSFIDTIYTYLYQEIREAFEKPTIHSKTVGEFFERWAEENNSEFFREIELKPRRNRNQQGWREHYKVSLELRNCIPSSKIADTLNQFGGGIMMSATLAPMDVYKEVTGLSLLSNNRTVETAVYGLQFPEPNRTSLAATIKKFKHEYKGSPFSGGGDINTSNPIRQNYADAMEAVISNTPGNILICMPSYPEAEWAGKALRNRVQKEILIDKSSSNKETEVLKQKFFDKGDKVLTTSAHGTLIEGVDYEGDKLNGVIVCGVPLENTRSPYSKAVQTAYENRFGDDGYDFAFTVPAVQKARQAIGRVIRQEEDKGVRVLLDERYTENPDMWDNVYDYLAPYEQQEFIKAEPETLGNQVQAFWKYHEQKEDTN